MPVCCGIQLSLMLCRQFILHLFQSISVSSGVDRMGVPIYFFHHWVLLPLETEMWIKCHMIQMSEWFYPIGNGLTSSGPSFLKKKVRVDLQYSPLSILCLKQDCHQAGSRENLAGSILLFAEGLQGECAP